jgi:hypothetical protein
VLPEIFILLIVPFQLSIMIALRCTPEIKLSVMTTVPLTVLAVKAGSTNASAFSSYCPATAVPVLVIWPLSKVNPFTPMPSISLRPMSWIDPAAEEATTSEILG